jgi:hypothetical protein
VGVNTERPGEPGPREPLAHLIEILRPKAAKWRHCVSPVAKWTVLNSPLTYLHKFLLAGKFKGASVTWD